MSDGYRIAYAHLARRIVNIGEKVVAGQIIGYADSTGNSHGSHLHITLYNDWEWGDFPHKIVDPTPFLMQVAMTYDVIPQFEREMKRQMQKSIMQRWREIISRFTSP